MISLVDVIMYLVLSGLGVCIFLIPLCIERDRNIKKLKAWYHLEPEREIPSSIEQLLETHKKVTMKKYNVILWDINSRCIKWYDIMPFIQEQWDLATGVMKRKLRNAKKLKVRDLKKEKTYVMPSDFDSIKKFILEICQYQFWSRCEYEILVDGFPSFGEPEKIDVYDQIEQNIDVITSLFMKNNNL